MSDPILSNRYKILRKLGEGGFGQTFLAEDLHLPTKPRCVVKRLKPHFADEETFKLGQRLFEQEAEMLYRLGNHPNIPNLLAHFEENGEFLLVQEFIEGLTLAEEFDGGRRYSEREAVDLLQQILETLSFVHGQNVIHRDIKPSNLIRRKSDGKIFLIDFGAVKQVNVNPFNQNPTFQSTVAIGSHGYMPSEQTAGKPRFASDLYATGLVAIEALTGINPLQLSLNRTTGEFVWLHKTRIHQEVGNFISRIVRYDFRQRYNSAKEAFAGLNMVAASLGFGRKNPVFVQPVQPAQFSPFVKQPETQMPLPAIPPTVAVPPQFQKTIPQPPQNSFHTLPKSEPKSLFNKIWNNDFALAGTIVLVVFGFFSVMGYTVVRYATATDKAQNVDSINAGVTTKNETRNPTTFQEAVNQAGEAEAKEKNATTKYEWEDIGSQYKRAYWLLTSIDAGNPDYANAQTKMREYQQKSEAAYQNAGTVKESPTLISNPNPANSPTTTVYSTPYPSATPYPATTATPKPVVTMPPKKSYNTYITYNFMNYDRLENKTITTNDALFTSSVEKQSENRRDSGVVRINIDGGSYSSARLELKAPYGQKLTSGSVSNAQEYLWQSPTMYAVSFDKLHCFEKGNHSFTINSIIYDDLYSSISLLDASFTINCGDRKVMGRIRYDARG